MIVDNRYLSSKRLMTFFCFLFVQVVFGQDSLVLTLDEAIDIALKQSYSIKNLEQNVVSAERNLWAAKAGYRTNIQSSIYAPAYDEGFKLIETLDGTPVAKQYGSFQVRGVVDIIQPMPWLPFGGGDLTFRSEAYQLNSWSPKSQNPDILDKSNQVYTSLSVIINKPLFTINETSLALKQAELNYERQSKTFTRSELDLVYNITNGFFQLYRANEQYKINQENVDRQDAIYQTTKNKFNAGLIAEVDAMQAEVDLYQFQNDLKTSEGRLEEQEASFKQLIGIPLDVNISVVTELELKPVVVDVERAVALALQNRSEIVEQEIAIENQKITIQQTDARVSVTGSLNGSYRFSGFSDRELPWGTTTGVLFKSAWEVLKQTPNRGITFTLEIPIFDWGRNKAQVEAQEATLRANELQLDNLYITIEREVRDVVRSVSEAWDRLQLLQVSSEVSQKSFDISLQRFNNGDITSTDLARASDQLNTARLSYLTAYNDYTLALADLRRKTLYDFETDQSLVE